MSDSSTSISSPGSVRVLLAQLAVAAVLLAVLDVAFARYTRRHFVPFQNLDRAVAAGAGCALVLGESRMVAAVNTAQLTAGLSPAGIPCVANMTMGALPLAGQVMAYRHYRAAGRVPAVVVLGLDVPGLVRPPVEDPSTLRGNEAAVLYWSKVSDVSLLYPGYPRRHFDKGSRFLMGRSTTIGSLASLVWERTQDLQARLAHLPSRPRNRFGTIDEMRELARRSRAMWLDILEGGRDDGGWVESPWLRSLLDSLRGDRIPLVVVEMPVASALETSVRQTPIGQSYTAWVRARSARGDFGLIDLSRPAWFSDEMLEDGIHMTPAGARLFTADLASRMKQ
jgi:hypothetical protein